MTRIAVIGAGPAGMMAACYAASAGAQVTIIDSNDQVGRKLLVTGAGRCNLTNVDVAAVRYACENPVWLNQLLLQYSREDLLRFLESIGVPSFSTADGWYYPLSESARAVADAFDTALNARGVQKLLKRQVTDILPGRIGFTVAMHREEISADRVVLASGGKAYPTLGSDGSLFAVARRLGHEVRPVYPALAPVTADMRAYQEISGVRLDAEVTLKQAGVALGKTFGNLIFTAWGVNGPAVMDLSYLVHTYSPKDMTLELNFLHRQESWFRAQLANSEAGLTARVLVQSVLAPKMAAFILGLAGISADSPCAGLSTRQQEVLLRYLLKFELVVTGTRGFEHCQVSSGGVSVEEVDPLTMASLRVAGLYLAGEVLDVIGPCGGYNLHFAFSSGAIAGLGAAAGKST